MRWVGIVASWWLVGALGANAYDHWPKNWSDGGPGGTSSKACAEWMDVSSPFPGYECAMYRVNGSVVCRELDERGRQLWFECKEG